MQEKLLINQCVQKNHFAQRMLYEQYVQKIFLVAIRYLEDESKAEEITADCFVKYFEKISSFEHRGDGSFLGWLRKIAINECV